MVDIRTISKRFAAIFKAHGWKWGGNGGDQIPRRYDIEETIRELRRDLQSLDASRAGTGRIEVFKEGTKTFVSIERGPTFRLKGLKR